MCSAKLSVKLMAGPAVSMNKSESESEQWLKNRTVRGIHHSQKEIRQMYRTNYMLITPVTSCFTDPLSSAFLSPPVSLSASRLSLSLSGVMKPIYILNYLSGECWGQAQVCYYNNRIKAGVDGLLTRPVESGEEEGGRGGGG